MRLALQTLTVLAAGSLLGVGANALSPRPTALGSAVHARAATSGMCAAPPAEPAPAPFAPAPPPAASFAPAPPAAPFQPAIPPACPACGLPAAMQAGAGGACGTCHPVPGYGEVVR